MASAASGARGRAFESRRAHSGTFVPACTSVWAGILFFATRRTTRLRHEIVGVGIHFFTRIGRFRVRAQADCGVASKSRTAARS